MKLRHYLSCFGPQFVRGLGVLATRANGDPKRFFTSALTLPDFHHLQKSADSSHLQSATRIAVWVTIAIAWVVMATTLFIVQLPLVLWLGLAIVVSLIAPFVLIMTASLFLALQKST